MYAHIMNNIKKNIEQLNFFIVILYIFYIIWLQIKSLPSMKRKK
jgi:hypothetical protein